MSSEISIDHWIRETLSIHGNIISQRDLEDFIEHTGAGATKFNKWMKRAGLRFDKKLGCWLAPMDNGKPILIPTGTTMKYKAIRNSTKQIKNSDDEVAKLYAPDENGDWPINEFDNSNNLSKYRNDEIYKLANLNPGIGFKEFVTNLYPSSPGSAIDSVRRALEQNSDFDFYSLLQNPIDSSSKCLTKSQEFTTVQAFNWGDILPEWERKSHHLQRFGAVNKSVLLNIRYDFRKIWNYDEDGYSLNEVCYEMDLPYSVVRRWTNAMRDYNSQGILDDWLELVEVLNSYSAKLNIESYEQEKDNDLYLFIRKITQSYLKSPQLWERRPSLDHLEEIFSEIIDYELEELDETTIDDKTLTNNLFLIGNKLDSKTNFQFERMLKLEFYEPLLEQSVYSQVANGADCVLIDVDQNIPTENIIEFSRRIISEAESMVFIDGNLTDLELFENPIIDNFTKDEQEKVIFSTNVIGAAKENKGVWMFTPPISRTMWSNSLEMQKIYFDSAIKLCSEHEFTDRVWLRPLFTGFLPFNESDKDEFKFNFNALSDYFGLIEHLASSGHSICADFRNALNGVNSIGNVSKIFHSAVENKCIESGANCIITDTISRDQKLDVDLEISGQIENLFNGVSFEFLDENTGFDIESIIQSED